ncbi:hypothetical protein B7P33_08420 [Sediminicola luteus]|uniref:Uncharacterized protein n=1 Tax=Sediminicola luteus TaxID=319238 RepID=A0A2A4G8L4_9FLAO|nr:hypothetical protein B7P33_08420 [Sediminicola luteus]
MRGLASNYRVNISGAFYVGKGELRIKVINVNQELNSLWFSVLLRETLCNNTKGSSYTEAYREYAELHREIASGFQQITLTLDTHDYYQSRVIGLYSFYLKPSLFGWLSTITKSNANGLYF